MIVMWKVRYLDQNDRKFKDRNLNLNTESLDSVTKAAVEFVLGTMNGGLTRAILKFRNLFRENASKLEREFHPGFMNVRCACIPDYFEDENGKEIALEEMGPILTGKPNTVLIPPGARPHDVEFTLSELLPIPISNFSLSSEDLKILAYFARDWQELCESVFMANDPITLSGISWPIDLTSARLELKTAVSDDEIRSHVTIFRRLCLLSEPGSFKNAAKRFAKVFGGNPYAKWVEGTLAHHEAQLDSVPDFRPAVPQGGFNFTSRDLLEIYVYTQYAHQPDEKRKRDDQFRECLAQVGNNRTVLAWMFLSTMRQRSAEIVACGRTVVRWFQRYCEHNQISPQVIESLCSDQPGIGSVEKEEDRKARLLQEAVAKLAVEFWKQRSQPEGGPALFHDEAEKELRQVIENGQSK